MSDYLGSPLRDRRSLRRAVVLLALLLALALVAVGGSLLRPESAVPQPARSAVVGRTSVVCTVPPPAQPTPSPGPTTASPGTPGASAPATPDLSAPTPPGPGATPSANPGSAASPSTTRAPAAPPTPGAGVPPSDGASVGPPSAVSAVTVRQGGQGGTVTAVPLGAGTGEDAQQLQLSVHGTGQRLTSVTRPVVLQAEGAMASALSGVVASTAGSGETAGLMAAPCLAPATEQWFAGLGSNDADRTELILSNPDDAQAEVDLRFYGPNGRVVVPGSPGVVVRAGETRTVSVSGLVQSPGPVSVAVRASEGRVSVAARRLRTQARQPAGADWQTPSAAPTTDVVIPGVPGGRGRRVLQVVNPGTERAAVSVEVLGLSGAFAPAGAATVDVPAESTAEVELTTGLAGESGSIRLRSGLPVSAAVVSTSERDGAGTDLAVQSAQPPLVRQGVSAVATDAASTASELVLSNGGDADAAVTFEVVSYEGVSLRRDDILLAAGSSATRRLTSPGPSYVVVTVPDGSSVVGSVTLTQPEGAVAGLATVPLTSPDVASRAPRVEQDPAVGR